MQGFMGAFILAGLILFSIGCFGLLILKPMLFFVVFRGIGRFEFGRPILTVRECAGLAAFRAVCELPVLLVVVIAVANRTGSGSLAYGMVVWLVVLCLRATAWFIVGAVINGLDRRSLWMLVACGVGVDIAVDIALVLGVIAGVWLYVLLFVVVLAIFSASLLPRSTSAEGNDGGPRRCGSCGYDLRGNRSGRCPECGQLDEWASSKNYGDCDAR